MASLNALLADIGASMENETKSSVGDKHETARARMQFEQGKLEHQLKEVKEQVTELTRIDLSNRHHIAGFGSLLQTNKALFFISISLGKITVEGKDVYVISPLSPIAAKMKGMKTGQSFGFNGVEYSIQDIS